MEIEVNYKELYKLSEYLIEKSSELLDDSAFLTSVSDSLSQVLQGHAEETIVKRMKNFNETSFKKVTNYTKLLGNEVSLGAKLYNSEDDEFEQKMNNEASKYENMGE